jgi:hypothetical protein
MYSKGLTGWEDLVSFLVFLEAVAGGFLAGLIVEGVYFIRRMTKK